MASGSIYSVTLPHSWQVWALGDLVIIKNAAAAMAMATIAAAAALTLARPRDRSSGLRLLR